MRAEGDAEGRSREATRRPPRRPEAGDRTERSERPDRPDRAERPDRADSRARAQRSREASKERRGGRRRIEPVTTHRNEALASLRPEQLPVAEQLLRGGIPAVRQAIEEQIQRSSAEGRPQISAEPLMAMAEQLLPVMNLANWKDRAVTVRNAGRDAPLRELRSVVSAASSVNLDEDARGLLNTLRETLESRVTALRDTWLGRMNSALDEGHVAEALRISARPPEPGARLPGDLAVRLSAAASAAMSPDCDNEQWKELLDAVVESPVRRNVKPAGLPTAAGDELLNSARRAAGSVPELARLLGLPIPPPPGPRRPAMAGGRRS